MMLIFGGFAIRKHHRVAIPACGQFKRACERILAKIGRRLVPHDKYAIYAREVNSRFHVAFFAEMLLLSLAASSVGCEVSIIAPSGGALHSLAGAQSARSARPEPRTRAAFRLDTDGGHRCHGFQG